jgi:flavin-dependent dehydrogenase
MKSRKTDMEKFFFDTIALCPPLAARLEFAKLSSAVTATGNFSYTSERCSGSKYIMIGDAFAFIDPVFSSGVFLAMNSAFVGADTVEACLKSPERATGILKKFEKDSRYGLKIFSWIIYRMTTPAMRNMFMKPSNKFRLQETLLSVLAGDLYRDTPIRFRLQIFKLVYYIMSIKMLGKTYKAWRRRKYSIKNVAFEANPT